MTALKRNRDLNGELSAYLATLEKGAAKHTRTTTIAVGADGRATRTTKAPSGKITRKQTMTDAASARLQSGLTQSEFAQRLGVSLRTFQEWEQGRKDPSGAAKTLLVIAMRRPEVLTELNSA